MSSFIFEPSGKMKLPTQAELEQADETTAILAFTSGIMSDGKPYWAYVAVKPSLYHEFHAVSERKKNRVIGDYGTVLAAGFESVPPAHIAAEMAAKYGSDPHYEEKLIRELRKKQADFISQKEDKRLMDIVSMLKKLPS